METERLILDEIDHDHIYEQGVIVQGWQVCLKKGRKAIGKCALIEHPWKERVVLDLVYAIDPAFWNQKYGTEAAKAVLDYAFQVLKVERVHSIIRDVNEYSQIISVRLGMDVIDRMTRVHEGVEKPHYLYCVEKKEFLRN